MNRLDFFRNATLRICGSLEIEKALWDSFTYIYNYIPAEKVFLVHYEPEFGGVRFIAEAQLEGGRPLDAQIPLPGEARSIIESDILPPVFIDKDPHRDPLKRHCMHVLGGTDSSFINMRMGLDGRRLGVLVFRAEKGSSFSEDHIELLMLLREPFSIALSNCTMYRKLQKVKDLLADDNQYLWDELRGNKGGDIIGKDYGLKGVMEMVRQVAPLNSPVLLRGETGVGKEIIATAIHNMSPRREGPLIKVNCGAIPETLMDSELFGHEKGAFTGALKTKRGRFERAHGGTIFLDEIGELSPEAQVRMLRVLQEKEVERIGSERPFKVDIRVITATHRDLESMVDDGRFREDLYFRLKVFPIVIPPLRDRMCDIPSLVQHFIERKSWEMGLSGFPVLAPGAMDQLMSYQWPGNIRELENAIERAIILRKGASLEFPELRGGDGFDERGVEEPSQGQPATIDSVLSRHIAGVLEMTAGVIEGEKGAAKILGVHPSTLRHRMRKLGLPFGRNWRRGQGK